MLVPPEPIIPSHESPTSRHLSKGWFFRQADGNDDEWLPVDNVPSDDLLAHKKIPNPAVDLNELDVQWVGEASWEYKCAFPAVVVPAGHRVDLVFEGLDTFATVALNGNTILRSENMFVEHRLDVSRHINADEPNLLSVTFASALLKAREIQKQSPEHKWICWNGEPARLAARKAQYHWGWDWGPKLMACGIWKPVRLDIYQARISRLTTDIGLSKSRDVARVKVQLQLEGQVEGASVLCNISQGDSFAASQTVLVGPAGDGAFELVIDKPKLWWPAGHGQQPLYEITATLGDGKHIVKKKFGIRHIELVQQPDKHGKSFYFRINGRDVFGAGCNWIPADSFPTTISDERYRRWLELVVEGRQCMVRCWGGGIWEPDAFFDACDELGILVWQDFLFACGNYPVNERMIKSMREEARVQLGRLRDRACLALLAGNNEDYLVQESSGLTYDPKVSNPEKWLLSDFPARYLYEKLLPDLVREYAPHVIYHPGSPFGGGNKSANDPTVGDLHQWNVWHGTQEKYQQYEKLGGRFVSEFGMEAMPVLETVASFTTRRSELFPQSRTMDFHNKATGHERRLATYVRENLRMRREDLAGWIYLTQLAQSEAVSFAFSSWRRQWGRGRKVGGALYWQLNDCWPTTSWSLVDYRLRKKPAYYAVKRAMAPLAVHVRREHHDWSDAHAQPPDRIAFDVWVSSGLAEPRDVMVELRFISIRSGVDVQDRLTKSVVATPNATTEVISATVEDDFHNDPFVISARLFAGAVVSRCVDWPQPLKYVAMNDDRGLKVSVDGGRAWITTQKPVKCVVLEERDGVRLADNGFDAIPGEMRSFDVDGLAADAPPLAWTYYDQRVATDDRDGHGLLLGPPISRAAIGGGAGIPSIVLGGGVASGSSGSGGGTLFGTVGAGTSMKTVTPILIGSPTSPPRPRRRGLSVRFQEPPKTT